MLDIIDFIKKLFSKEETKKSGTMARERLKLVLVSDRASISPHMMKNMRQEILDVISRYMTVDSNSVELGLERKNGNIALAANIPIVNVKRNRKNQSGNKENIKKPEKIKNTSSSISPENNTEKPEEEKVWEKVSPSEKTEVKEKKKEERTPVIRRRKTRRFSKRNKARATGKRIRKKSPVK
ncbi:MAG: cell division topological specificity factor MinE [Vulcanimicrobiota bacterium]